MQTFKSPLIFKGINLRKIHAKLKRTLGGIDVLLVNLPWISTEREYGIRAGSRWAHTRDKRSQVLKCYPFPFYLAYTTAVLLRGGIQAMIKDCIAEEMDQEDFFRMMDKQTPNYMVIETSTPSFYNDLNYAKISKEEYGCTVILCGAHVSSLAVETLKRYSFIDFIMIGEYDLTSLELVKSLERGRPSLKKVKGLAFRDDGSIVVNEKRPLIANLDSLPYPARHQMRMELYNEDFCKHVPNVQMITSRGCPFSCIFCIEPVFYGKPNYRMRSPTSVVDEMEYLLKEYKPKEIYFDDTSFTINQARVVEICDEIIERGLDCSWSCMADANVKPRVLKKMKDAGCVGLKFGVESADPRILKRARKPLNLKVVESFVKVCKSLGLYTHATYMFGLPGETEESIKKTIEFAMRLNTDTAQFSIATPYPGTEFYRLAEIEGWLLTRNFSKFDGSKYCVVEYPECKAEEVQGAVVEAKRKLMLNIIRKHPTLTLRYIYNIWRLEGTVGLMRNVANKVGFLTKT